MKITTSQGNWGWIPKNNEPNHEAKGRSVLGGKAA